MNWPFKPRPRKKRSLLLQSLEERILWDATLAPEPEPVEADQAAELEQAASTNEQVLQEEPTTHNPDEANNAASKTDSAEADSYAADEASSQEQAEAAPSIVSIADQDTAQNADSTEPNVSAIGQDLEVVNVVGTAGNEQYLATAGTSRSAFDSADVKAVDKQNEAANQSAFTTQVVVIDARVEDYEALIKDAEIGVDDTDVSTVFVHLSQDQSGIEQVTNVLQQYDDVSALHIVSHGDDGLLYLGNQEITIEELSRSSGELGSWGERLTEDADILLYGCDVAETEIGKMFVDRLAQVTGADVAASTNDTGTADHGGDWVLEYREGIVSAESIIQSDGIWSGQLASAVASGSVTSPADVMIDESPSISLTFDNTGPDTGFAPFGDFVVDRGIDVNGMSYLGAPVVDFTPVATWNAAAGQWESSPGTAVSAHPFEADAGGAGGLALPDGTALQDGAGWYSFKLPFGSFVSAQPVATIAVDAEFNDDAIVGQAINMFYTPGFLLGCDETGADDPHVGATATATTTPTVIQITKTSGLTESETATGPNYPVEFTVTVNVAEGETVADVVVEDYLPSNANFIGAEANVTVAPINGATLSGTPTVTFTGGANPSQITVDLGDVTGTAVGAGEIQISYFVWFSDIVTSGGEPTINSVLSLNESSLSGEYTPPNGSPAFTVTDIDDNDTSGPDSSVDDGDVPTEVQNLTTQKSVQIVTGFDGSGNPIFGDTSDLKPGSILFWTVEIQVSDYHAFDNVLFTDVLSDGQEFLDVGVTATASDNSMATVSPTLIVNNDADFGANTNDSTLGLNDFTGANVAVTADSNNGILNSDSGSTHIVFDISEQLRDLGGDGILTGDLNASENGVTEASGGDTGTPAPPVTPRIGPNATTVTLTYYSQVQEAYDDAPGDNSLNAGDPVSNAGVVDGEVGDITNDDGAFTPLAPGGVRLADDTAQALAINVPEIEKTIFAVNGIEVQSPNIDEDDNESGEAILAGIQPGDVVTYRLRVEMNNANGENFSISDFLPLPVYDAGGEFALAPTFTNMLPAGVPGAAAVQAALSGAPGGNVFYGEDYNLHTLGADFNIVTSGNIPHPTDGSYPAVTLDAASNALFFDFGTFTEDDFPDGVDETSEPIVLDLLLNITVQDVNFVDGLFLTNQTQVTQDDTFGNTITSEDIVQIGYIAPVLTLTKGVVALSGTTNGTSTPTFPDFGVTFDNTEPGAGPGAGDSLAFDSDGITLDDLAGSLGILDGNASDIDGADWVRYALTIQNTGQGDAQDVLISDTLPENAAGADGFVLPADSLDSAALISALNIQVYYGDGTRVLDSELEVGVVGGVLMVEVASEIDGRSLNDGGDEIADSDEIFQDPNPGAGGQEEVTLTVDGDEVLIITYDLQVDNELSDDLSTVVAGDVFDNTATIEEYYQTAEDDPIRDDDNNRALLDDPADLSDDATVAIAGPAVEKTLIGTELDTPNNALGNQVVIGERLTYEVRVTIPEGQALNAILDDSLDPGLELVSIDSVEVVDQDGNAVVGALTSSEWGADFSGFTIPLVDNTDTRITYSFNDAGSSQLLLDLGDIVNTNIDNSQDEVIVITYQVMVTNDAGSEQGDIRNNAASIRFNDSGGNSLESNTSRANNVIILEPLLEVVKTVEVDGVASIGNPNDEINPDTARGDEGDPVVYSIVIQHSGDSDTDAYDVNFEDVVPSDIVNVVLVNAIYSAGGIDLVASGDIVQSGNTLSTASDFTVALGETVTITVTGEIGASVGVGDLIDNTAEIDWTSYPETPAGTDFLPAGEEDVERGGGDTAPAGGEINDYEDQDPARIQIGANEIEKFLVNSEITDEPDATADGELAAADDADGVNQGVEAVIGETLSYQVVITLAEGESDSALMQDSLDPGLALVSIDSIYTQQLDTSDSSISNIAAVPNLTVTGLGLSQQLATAATAPGGIVGYTENAGTGGGDLITIDFGDIDNANDDDTILEQIVIQYTVMVRDEAANIGGGAGVPGTALKNTAQMTWQNSAGAAQSTSPDSADPIEVIEPDLEVLKDVLVDGPGDAGDEVTYTLIIRHTGSSESDAFDVSLYDELPDQVDFSAVNFATGANVTITDTLGTLGTADLEIDAAAGGNGALQFAATSNTSIDTTVTGSSQNTVDMPLTVAARVITITLTGVLEDSVQPGDIISNDAEINYSSLNEHNDGDPDGDDEDDRSGFVADGSEGERDYSDSDPSDDVTIPGPAIAKELVDSDVDSADNAENQATIGEIITYRVIVDVPEGSMSNAQIVDDLTPGLEFVDLVSITGTANGSMVVSNTIDLEDPDAVVTSTSGTAASGHEITFSLGDIVATGDNDGAPPAAVDQGLDQIIIEYRVVVQDIPLNVDGAVRDNSASFQFETTNEAGDTVAQSTATVDAEDITLIEPELEVIKTVNGEADGDPAGPLDAGDAVTYTIVIQHTGDSTTDAYDVDFTDAIPIELENVTLDSAIYSLDSSDLAGTDIIISGNDVTTANPFTVLFGQTITITVSGEIANAVGPGELVANTAEIDWTSLPAGHENDGAAAERGDPSDPDDVYSDDDPAEFFTDIPEFSKGVISTSIHGDGGDGEVDLTIGEEVTFELVVTLPEGTTPVVVTDNLPPLVALAPFTGDTDGVLEVVSAEVSFVGAGIIASSTGLAQGDDESSTNIIVNDASSDGFNDQVIFDFGTVEVDGDNVIVVGDNVIRVTITAVVKNLPGTGGAINENGDELTNEATLNFAADPANPGPGQVLIDDATVDIIEPELEIDKEFIDPVTGIPITATVTPGDTVRIRLEVTNVGTANAYDVTVLDSYNADQPVFENPSAVTVPPGFTYAADPGAGGLGDDEVSFTSGSGVFIASGATLVFEFDVVVTEDEIGVGALEGLTVANTASVSGDSLSGDNPEERDTEDDDTDILVGDPDLEKSIISTSVADTASGEFDGSIEDVTIGETVTYQLLITLPETDLNNNGISELSELVTTTLTDNLPDNLDLVSASVVSTGSDITMSNFVGGETLGDPDILGAPGDASVTFNLGDIAIIDAGDDGNLADQQVVIQVTAIVKDDPLNIADADKINVATLNYGSEAFTDSATVEIVEPVLEITKNFVDPGTGQPIFAAESGETVRIVLEIENTGSATAYDVVVSDSLVGNVLTGYFVDGAASVVSTDPGFTDSSDTGNNLIEFSSGTVDAGATATFEFDVTLGSAMPPFPLDPNTIIDNTANVVGDSLPTGDPNADEQRTTSDEDDDELYGLPAIIKEVADNYDDVPPGDADFEATSHAGTDDSQFDPTLPDVAIGEVVTYEVTIVIPNTYDDPDLTTIATSITDTLPVGLGLIDARVVAIGGNRSAGATEGGEFVNDTNAVVTGGPASSGLAVGNSLAASSANISGTIGGSTVTFDFGGLAVDARLVDESGDGDAGVDDDDLVGDEQTIVVQIDAVILDDASNAAGDVKVNSAQLTWEEIAGDPIVIEDDSEIEIVEPELEITKSFIDPATGVDVYTVGEGDQVVAVLNVTNNGSANVYDVLVTDEIDLVNWIIIGEQVTPPGFIFSIEDGVNAVPADTVTYTMTSSLDAADPDNYVAPGETVTIEFILQYTGADDGGAQIDNTAEVTGNSLPLNEVLVIPGLDTVRDTEDEGSDFVYEDPGLEKVVIEGLNPDTGSEQHDPALVDLNIGEQVTYELTITLPESLLDASGAMIPVTVNLIDDLPGGFTVVGAEITGIGSAVTAADLAAGNTLTVLDPVTLGPGVPAATDDTDISSADINFPAPAGGDGFDDQVLFSFGGVTVDDVDNLALQTITVRVTAVVMDVETENNDGEVRTNDATLEFFGTPTGDPANPFDEIVPIEIIDSANVEIVEPELEIEKTFLNAAGTAEVESVTSGDTITVQLTVTNTGTGPAYDLVIEDPLDPTKFNISTISPVSTPAAFVFSLSGNSVIYTLDSGAGTPGSAAHVVTPGERVVLTFTLQVLEGIGPDTALNTATVDGDSAPGDNPFERDEPTKEGADELTILAVPLPPSISPPSQGLTGLENTVDTETLTDRVLRTYRYDIFDRLRDEYDELFEQIRRDLQTELPKLSANYMATGITEHGSNVTLIVYDETGAIVGYSSTLADTAGNWSVSFPQTVLDKSPHHVEVQVSPASYNESTAGEFNTRVYFTPATDARVAHYKGLQVGDVIAERADSLLESMHQGNQAPFGSPGANWNHPYEFLGTASIENL